MPKLIKLYLNIIYSEFNVFSKSYSVLSNTEIKKMAYLEFNFLIFVVHKSFQDTMIDKHNEICYIFNELSKEEINGQKLFRFVKIVLKSYMVRYKNILYLGQISLKGH